MIEDAKVVEYVAGTGVAVARLGSGRYLYVPIVGLYGARSGRFPTVGETVVIDHEDGRVRSARYDDYPSTKDDAVEEVVNAYNQGADNVRGGMCNVLLNIAANSEPWLKDDLLRLADALGKLSKLYEGPR